MKLTFNDLGQVPESSGIYRFWSDKNIVYIGKSKKLRSRLRSYFGKNHERKKLYIMMEYVDDFDFIRTDTHLEARLLEYRQIREYNPLYNSQYKKEKSQVYLAPGRRKVLELADSGLGPFLLTKGLRILLKNLRMVYPVYYHEGFDFVKELFEKKLTEKDIKASQEAMTKIFTDMSWYEEFIQTLEAKMLEASQGLSFEEALFYKNLLASMKTHVGSYFEKEAFHKKPQVFYSQDKKIFLITYKGHIVIKDRLENFDSYKDFDYCKIEDNKDIEYKNIIYSTYLSDNKARHKKARTRKT